MEVLEISPVKVIKRDGEWGVFATEDLKKGTPVIQVLGELRRVASRYSIQIDHNKHLDIPVKSLISDENLIWKFLNHSCCPNIFIDIDSMFFVTKSDVKNGEELRFDYNTTESKLAEPFICNCGEADCVGEVKGYAYLDNRSRKRVAEDLAAHLKQDF